MVWLNYETMIHRNNETGNNDTQKQWNLWRFPGRDLLMGVNGPSCVWFIKASDITITIHDHIFLTIYKYLQTLPKILTTVRTFLEITMVWLNYGNNNVKSPWTYTGYRTIWTLEWHRTYGPRTKETNNQINKEPKNLNGPVEP